MSDLLKALTKGLPPQWRWRILSRARGGTYAARALGVTVGERCRILSCQVRAEYDLLSMGNRVTVSSEVLFITHDGSGSVVRDEHDRRRYRTAPIRLGDNVFVGARVIFLPGVTVGDDCVIAAGSVVTKSIPAGSIVAGNPALVIGPFDDFKARALESWSIDKARVDDFKTQAMRSR